MSLAGDVALVTGAGAPRIGRAVALALAERGADVAVHYHQSASAAAETAGRIHALGRRTEVLAADLRDPAAASALPRRAADGLGGLDILIHCASVFRRTPLASATVADWDEVHDVDLRAAFLLAQAAAPLLKARRRGRIVFFADVAGLTAWPAYIPYSVAKAGVIALTKGLARTLAPEVTVNALAPGLVLAPEDASEAGLAQALRRVPLRRAGTPDDVVAAVLFLVDGTSYATGSVISIDGGRAID